MAKKIIIGTSNKGKIREIASILSPLGFEIETKSLDVDEIGDTIEDNADIKAIEYSKQFKDTYVLCDDSGLVVPSINGLPGPFSARFHSIGLDDKLNVISVPKEDFTTDKREHDRLNNERLVDIIKNVKEENRTGFFEVCFSIAKNGKILHHCSARSFGTITTKPKGNNGFGYDPIFLGNDTFGKTYAELDSSRKNLRSHRKKALKEISFWMVENLK